MLLTMPFSIEADDSKYVVALVADARQAPYVINGNDGTSHLVFQLIMTNVAKAEMSLIPDEIIVLDSSGRRLQTLDKEAVSRRLRPIAAIDPLSSIAQGQTAILLMDVPVNRTANIRQIQAYVHYGLAPGMPLPALYQKLGINWTTSTPLIKVSTFKPVSLALPLRGTDWLASNACCDPDNTHFDARSTKGGALHINETFAIDFITWRDGRQYEGDGSQNAQYYAYGAPVYSASNGVVVSIRDEMPDEPPGLSPTHLTSLDEYSGNYVFVRMAPDVYVIYAHFIPGSINVTIGQHVHVGQLIGKLGNSGNSSGSHLHFQVSSTPDIFAGESLPYVFKYFMQEETYTTQSGGDPVPLDTIKQLKRGVYPFWLTKLGRP